jgi:hypothetical protein
MDNSTRHATYVLRPQPSKDETDPAVLHDHIEVLTEELAEAYLKSAGVPPEAHSSECFINQAPAYRPGPCNCGAAKR